MPMKQLIGRGADAEDEEEFDPNAEVARKWLTIECFYLGQSYNMKASSQREVEPRARRIPWRCGLLLRTASC